MYPEEPLTEFYSHMALLVHLDGEDYLVDVGNGRYFGDPLPISGNAVSVVEGITYKVMPFNDTNLGLFFLENADDTQWQARYAFKPMARSHDYFDKASHFVETSSDSIFTQSTLISIQTANGLITLSKRVGENEPIFWKDYGKEKHAVSQQEYLTLLTERFGLKHID